MLLQAKDSYRRANECEGDGSEDDWLTHYMMGKVAEKQGESPKVFLDSYKQVIYEQGAAKSLAVGVREIVERNTYGTIVIKTFTEIRNKSLLPAQNNQNFFILFLPLSVG